MNRAAAERKKELKAHLVRLRCEWSVCAEKGVFGFVAAAASRWETDPGLLMGEEGALQWVL